QGSSFGSGGAGRGSSVPRTNMQTVCASREPHAVTTGGVAGSGVTIYALGMNNVTSHAGGGSADGGAGRRRVVLKFGSRLLTGGSTTLDPERMRTVAEAIASVPDADVVVVSSGAIAAGFRTLGHTVPPSRISDRQAAAAIGQTRLMALWSAAFTAVGKDVAQILLTNDCLTDRRRYVAARRALQTLLDAGVVPIVNENDTVSVEEIVVGDNDNL